MSAARAYVVAAGGILQRDLRVQVSYRMRFVMQFVSVLFSLTLFYYLSRLLNAGFASPDEYFAFAVVGIVILQVVSSVLALPPMAFRQELVAGSWERMAVSPLGPVGTILGLMAWPFVQASLMAVVTLTFATVVFGTDVEWGTAVLALPAALLSALAFLPFGVFLVAGVLAFKQASVGATWIITGVSLVGGLYFPVALLPDWIEWASHVQPFTPAADLMRHLLIGTELGQSSAVDIAKLAGFAAVLLPLSLLSLRRVLERTRRSGTIVEY